MSPARRWPAWPSMSSACWESGGGQLPGLQQPGAIVFFPVDPSLCLGVYRHSHLEAGLGGLIGRGMYGVGIGTAECFLQVGDGRAELGGDVGGHVAGVLGEGSLGCAGECLGTVACRGLLAALAVLVSIFLRVGGHPLDVAPGQRATAGDSH